MLADPHFAAREAIIDVEHPRWGTLKMQNVFPKLSATPGNVRSIAPQTVGQDNAEVYGSILGLTATELADLERRGLI
jgi:formyl-CoA transferase